MYERKPVSITIDVARMIYESYDLALSDAPLHTIHALDAAIVTLLTDAQIKSVERKRKAKKAGPV